MLNDTQVHAQLRRAIADLVGTAQSDLLPADKLALLCSQIGTLAFWVDQLEADAASPPPAPGPHWKGRPSELRHPS